MKKSLIAFLVVLALSYSAFAGPVATLGDLKGKVEVKKAQGDWLPATEGMIVDLNTTISTGFDSSAMLTMDKTTVLVKPLTRLTLDKLLEQSPGSNSTSLYLRVGSVQAKVKSSVPGTPQDFKVQSPYSTASVRGTEFVFDGFNLSVLEGLVYIVPGRPVRDIQEPVADLAEDQTGFEGAVDVGMADESLAMLVSVNQSAIITIPYHVQEDVYSQPIVVMSTPSVTVMNMQKDSVIPLDTTPLKRKETTSGGVKITVE